MNHTRTTLNNNKALGGKSNHSSREQGAALCPMQLDTTTTSPVSLENFLVHLLDVQDQLVKQNELLQGMVDKYREELAARERNAEIREKLLVDTLSSGLANISNQLSSLPEAMANALQPKQIDRGKLPEDWEMKKEGEDEGAEEEEGKKGCVLYVYRTPTAEGTCPSFEPTLEQELNKAAEQKKGWFSRAQHWKVRSVKNVASVPEGSKVLMLSFTEAIRLAEDDLEGVYLDFCKRNLQLWIGALRFGDKSSEAQLPKNLRNPKTGEAPEVLNFAFGRKGVMTSVSFTESSIQTLVNSKK